MGSDLNVKYYTKFKLNHINIDSHRSINQKLKKPHLLLLFIIVCSCQEKLEPLSQLHEGIDIYQINTIVILGNSLTIAKPAPHIGWQGNWGMAASSKRKDYVHILKSKLHAYNRKLKFKIFSASNFEGSFWEFNYEQLDRIRALDPELIIINLGENVKDSIAEMHDFGYHLTKLAKYLDSDGSAQIICVNSFTPRDIVNHQILNTCQIHGFMHVAINDIGSNWNYRPRNVPETISSHPSDLGMEKIAEKILIKMGYP